jgi:hypothetical protein
MDASNQLEFMYRNLGRRCFPAVLGVTELAIYYRQALAGRRRQLIGSSLVGRREIEQMPAW